MADYIADCAEVLDLQDLDEGSTFFQGVSEACAAVEQILTLFDDPLTPTTFRLQFPAFKDTLRYTERQVQFYIDMSAKMLRVERWGSMLKEGQALFVAHFLALDRLAQLSPGGIAGVPGSAVGVLNSGSVDKVSFGKDVQSVMEDGAGHWGMSIYGMQYLRFARMMGAGPVQIGVGAGVQFGSAFLFANGGGLTWDGGAWPGPYLGP